VSIGLRVGRRADEGDIQDMKFMMLVKANSAYEAGQPPPPGLMEAIAKMGASQQAKGILLQSGGLAPSSRGARVVVTKGKVSVKDGPFAEVKELIGGFAIMRAGSLEEAKELGRAFMQVHVDVMGPSFDGELEIRQLFDQEQ
jgi:hypothetical protein